MRYKLICFKLAENYLLLFTHPNINGTRGLYSDKGNEISKPLKFARRNDMLMIWWFEVGWVESCGCTGRVDIVLLTTIL